MVIFFVSALLGRVSCLHLAAILGAWDGHDMGPGLIFTSFDAVFHAVAVAWNSPGLVVISDGENLP